MKKSNATRASAPNEKLPEPDAASRIAALLRATLSSLPPGSRLPSVRELTEQHAASPVTVQRALSQLSREGRVLTRPGDGTFVAQAPHPSAPVDVGFQSLALGPAWSATELTGTPFVPPAGDLL